MAKKHSIEDVSWVRVEQDKPPMDLDDETVTCMIQNLPTGMKRKTLMRALDELGFWGTYDFIYLPFDWESGINKGYAFINFTKKEHAKRFKTEFEGYQLTQKSDKICLVASATVQGFKKLKDKFGGKHDVNQRPRFQRPIMWAKPPWGPACWMLLEEDDACWIIGDDYEGA